MASIMAETIMTAVHCEILIANRSELVRVLDVDLIINDLLSKGVLNTLDEERITCKPTNQEKRQCLLGILPTKADTAYDKFIMILRKHQKHVANLLEPQRVEEKNEAIDCGRSALFLWHSKVARVIPGAGKGAVYGIAVLGSQLFIARGGETSVEVYNTNNMTKTARLLKISDQTLDCPRLAACSHYNCLYVRHWSGTDSVMYRVELSDSSVSRWGVAADYMTRGGGLSMTTDHNVLLTMYATQRVLEYSTTGLLMREISLDSSIDFPCHCVQLSDGNFVICHEGLTEHRVCIVDSSGRIIKSYGGSKGSSVDQLHVPCQLSIDKYDHVFVADCDNNRVQLLSPALTPLGTIQIPGHRLTDPFALHFDQINHRLYVDRGSDVLVLELNNAEK